MIARDRDLAIICECRLSYEVFRRQILDFVGNPSLSIARYVLEEEKPRLVKEDLVLCASQWVFKKYKDYIPNKKQVIVARRTLDIANLTELMSLPPGTKALLVSPYKYTADDAIDTLHRHGVTHVTLVPFVPGQTHFDPGITVAITCGMSHLVPPWVTKIVDIGLRKLDLSTLVALQTELGIARDKIDNVSTEYTRRLIRVTADYVSESQRAARLAAQLEAILNSIDEAVLGVEPAGTISFANQVALNLFANEPSLIGKNVDELWDSLKREANCSKAKSAAGDHAQFIVEVGSEKVLASEKPIFVDHCNAGKVVICRTVQQIQAQDVEIRRHLVRNSHTAVYSFDDIYGRSKAILHSKHLAKQFSESDLTVLLLGETGTGKELFAHAIHKASRRKNGPFVAVNLASLPESLAESELFGYEEGAFTGARRGGKPGFFEQAHGGTLFIDEISEAPPSIQSRLLRVLQEKRLMRVGGTKTIPVDVRVMASSNQDLLRLSSEGKFRMDLYYRLNVLTLHLPPLRERREDIPILISEISKRKGYRLNFTQEALEALLKYDWPGNIRQLEHLLDYLATCSGGAIGVGQLPPEYLKERPCDGDGAMKGSQGNGALVAAELGSLNPFIVYKILDALQSHALTGASVGRRRLLNLLSADGLPVTESVLRRYLQRLASLGAVGIGRRRQGSQITVVGIELHRHLSDTVALGRPNRHASLYIEDRSRTTSSYGAFSRLRENFG